MFFKKFFIGVLLVCGLSIEGNAKAFTFSATDSDINITTSKTLHYGVLPKNSLYDNDGVALQPSYTTLFFDTKKIILDEDHVGSLNAVTVH